jgi:uncharacterized damage-inducible protein DinB
MDYERRHFEYLARYNAAANGHLAKLLSALPPGEFEKPRLSYFGSMQGLFAHILVCDINWLRRFRSLFPESAALGHERLAPAGFAWTDYAFPDFADLRRSREVVDRIFVDWIAGADMGRFGEVLAYTDSRGKPMRYYLCDAADHVFNHQTHHRGQISQILDELGVAHDFSNLLDAAEKAPA